MGDMNILTGLEGCADFWSKKREILISPCLSQVIMVFSVMTCGDPQNSLSTVGRLGL